ncbi:M1 family metallopeptidase [Streptacidiphilus anmyonensis]|uniref:M1 family metallopeptidase n=1 Tax=Streptacidiphilus anmyonensis TaxID=405782 RepID=UPI000693C9E8|nr:M1 family metallopeptidase [Streptacidiphilus anmyonensis]
MTNRLFLTAAATVFAVAGLLGAAAPATPVGTKGAAGAGDPLLPLSGDGGLHVRHYALQLAYQPKTQHLDGSAVLSATATQDLSGFDLDLSGLDVHRVTVDGQVVAFDRAGPKLEITLDRPVTDGSDFTVAVDYGGTPHPVVDADGTSDGWTALPGDQGAFVAGEPQGAMTWFPCDGHPTDKSTYDVTVTVPQGYTAVSNGVLRTQHTAAGRSTFRWHESAPMAAYLATASVGRFDVREYWSRRLPVYTAVDPAEKADADGVLDQLPAVISWESSLFGPYPFDSAGAIVVHDKAIGYALETQTRPLYDEAPDLDTLVHETAHQWFGDSVTITQWKDIWLNEGFATYAEWMWDAAHGGASPHARLAQLYARPATDQLWSYPPGDPGQLARLFGVPSYARGAMALQELREAVGDQAFFGILKRWTAEHRYGHGTTAQFAALSASVSGKNLDPLFATWLYSAGKPTKM